MNKTKSKINQSINPSVLNLIKELFVEEEFLLIHAAFLLGSGFFDLFLKILGLCFRFLLDFIFLDPSLLHVFLVSLHPLAHHHSLHLLLLLLSLSLFFELLFNNLPSFREFLLILLLLPPLLLCLPLFLHLDLFHKYALLFSLLRFIVLSYHISHFLDPGFNPLDSLLLLSLLLLKLLILVLLISLLLLPLSEPGSLLFLHGFLLQCHVFIDHLLIMLSLLPPLLLLLFRLVI